MNREDVFGEHVMRAKREHDDAVRPFESASEPALMLSENDDLRVVNRTYILQRNLGGIALRPPKQPASSYRGSRACGPRG
jgi:hypothetical protein